MKFFTAAALLVGAFVSGVVCVPFLPTAKEHAFALDVRLTTASYGHVQVYYDNGSGFSEEQSAAHALTPGPDAVTYRLPLPSGTYRQFRLDPIEKDQRVTLESIRVVTRKGELVRDIPLAQLKREHDIARLEPRGRTLEVVPNEGAQDPQLLITFDPAWSLEVTRTALFSSGLQVALPFFIAVALGLLAIDRLPQLRHAGTHGLRGLATRPSLAIAAAAALAVMASSYPVVFLGKSFVSPDLGTRLLYDGFPTLPEYDSSEAGGHMGSDIGAIMWQHVPLSVVQARALQQGELPLWNRYDSTGAPLLGQGQSMFGDPLHLITLAAKGASWAWDLRYLLAKWLFAFAMGVIVLELGRFRASAPTPGVGFDRWIPLASAVIVAAGAPFIGFFVYRFNHPAFFSLCYAPWALYCWLRVTAASGARASAAWAGGLMLANLALMNSGTAKEAYMLLLAMNFAGACVLGAANLPWPERLRKFGLLGWAGVLLVLITAPVWATFLHELHGAYTSYNAISAYQIQPSLLLGAFDEIFYRPLMPADFTFGPSLNFLLLLGFLYFLATLRAQFSHRVAITLATVSALPLSLAFGLIPASWIVRLPLLANVAHIDNTFSCVLIVLWGALAGVGVATALHRLRTPEGRGDLIVVGLLLAALVFDWIAFRQVVHRPIWGPTFTVHQPGHVLAVAPFIWGYLVSLLLASAVLLLAARRALRSGIVTPAIAMLWVLAAVVLCWRFGLHSSGVGFEKYVLHPAQRVAFQAKSDAVAFLQAAQKREPSRAYGLHSNFLPDWTAVYGLETIHGPDALMSPQYRELVDAMGGMKRIVDWRLYLEPRDIPAARPYLDSLNVRYYLDLHSERRLFEPTLRLAKLADLDVYESPTVWPRAFFADRVFTYDKIDELVGRIREANGRPLAAVAAAEAAREQTLAALMNRTGDATTVSATNYRLTENTTAFDVHATGPGVVVLLEAWWPGDFRARVNGRGAAVVRVNHAFKGVVVPAAGDYRIEFRCVPKGWSRNLALCGTGVALLLGSAVVFGRRRPARA